MHRKALREPGMQKAKGGLKQPTHRWTGGGGDSKGSLAAPAAQIFILDSEPTPCPGGAETDGYCCSADMGKWLKKVRGCSMTQFHCIYNRNPF